MTDQPRRYRRRGRTPGPDIWAWQVTPDNRDAVARWCHGRVEYRLTDPSDIRVRPAHCVTSARFGDYIAEVTGGGWWYPVKRLLFKVFYEGAHMASTRAKFRCQSVEFWGDPSDENAARNYTFQAVYDHGTPENRRFTKATPWGELKMRVENPEVQLEVGKYYYLDFTPADES